MANPGPNLTESAERAGRMIRGLQSRLMGQPGESPGANKDEPKQEIADQPAGEDLDRELQQYFATSAQAVERPPMVDEIRSRALDGVVDKILREWEESDPGALEHELADRLIQRLLDRLG